MFFDPSLALRRTVVSLATPDSSHFQAGLNRLSVALQEFDHGVEQKFYRDIPPGWPKHSDKPYAFKPFALMEASKTSYMVLWCDSVIVPIRPMKPLWYRIERDGYFIAEAGNGNNNYQWTANSAYADLFPDVSIEEARETSKTFLQVHAAVIGLNLKSSIGAEFLREYYRLAKDTNAFVGPWSNTADKNCGPSDVKGHRHDQTAASLIAWRLGMKLARFPEPYAYQTPAEGTILLHDGAGVPLWRSPNVEQTTPAPRKLNCPECGSEAVGMAGGMRNCNQCQYRW